MELAVTASGFKVLDAVVAISGLSWPTALLHLILKGGVLGRGFVDGHVGSTSRGQGPLAPTPAFQGVVKKGDEHLKPTRAH